MTSDLRLILSFYTEQLCGAGPSGKFAEGANIERMTSPSETLGISRECAEQDTFFPLSLVTMSGSALPPVVGTLTVRLSRSAVKGTVDPFVAQFTPSARHIARTDERLAENRT